MSTREHDRLIQELEALRKLALQAAQGAGDQSPPMLLGGLRVTSEEALSQLEQCVDALRSVLGREFAEVSVREVRHHIGAGLRARLTHVVDEETVKGIIELIQADPLEDWTFTRRLHGATMNTAQVLSLGRFMFWQWPENMQQVVARVGGPAYAGEGAKALDFEDGAVFATLTGLRARTSSRAQELGDEQFSELDGLLGYVLRWADDFYDLGVLSFRQPRVFRRMAHTATRTSTGREQIGAFLKISLDDPIVASPMHGNHSSGESSPIRAPPQCSAAFWKLRSG